MNKTMSINRTGLKVSIRRTEQSDFEAFRYMLNSRLKDGMLPDGTEESLWKDRHSDQTINFAIKENSSQEVCGFGSLQYYQSSTPEIGIDIIVGYQNKGYAQEAVQLMMEYAKANLNVKYFIWKSLNINGRSQYLAEKLGGVFCEKESLFTDEQIESYIETGIFKSKEDALHILVFHIPA